MNIRPVHLDDAENLAAIYNHYIASTIISFETEPVSSEEMASRLRASQDQKLPWLIGEDEGGILGYAYASPWKGRHAYRYTIETTIYLDPGNVGRGIGERLYSRLLDELRGGEFHSAIGGIALPNDASVRLHEKLGFRKVAQFHEVGFKQDHWIDVAYWQLML